MNSYSNHLCADFTVKKLLVSLFLLFCFQVQFTFCITAAKGTAFDIITFTLKNGLRVICMRKANLPIISFSIWYNCGSCCDATSKSGVAHYLEHMAFAMKEGVFDKFLEEIGAQKNAFTSMKTICFYEVIPAEHIETIIENEAMRVSEMDIDEKKFISERGAILEERSYRIDTDPEGQRLEILLANLFNRADGGISIIGWEHEIKSITPKDLTDFHAKWFAPNNATIIIIGNIDVEQIKSLVEKNFGNIKSKVLPSKDSHEKPLVTKEINFSSPKNGSFASVDFLYRVPFLVKSDFRKHVALKLVMQILNQPSFFVKKTLEDTTAKSSSVNFSYFCGYFHYDLVGLCISCPSINYCVDCEKIWTDYLKNKLLNTKLKQSDLDTVKKQEQIARAYQKDDITKISNHFGWMLASGFSVEQIQSLNEVVQSITIEECQGALREVFANNPIAISRVTPKRYNRDE